MIFCLFERLIAPFLPVCLEMLYARKKKEPILGISLLPNIASFHIPLYVSCLIQASLRQFYGGCFLCAAFIPHLELQNIKATIG